MSEHSENTLVFVEQVRVRLISDLDLDIWTHDAWMEPSEVVKYLNDDPWHAVVLVDLKEVSGEVKAGDPVYILRDAGESLNGFFYGKMPCEGPDDTIEGDLTAEEALAKGLDVLCGG